jgi:hypothetical protein
MARPLAKDIAVKSALAQLWCIAELADEERRLVDTKAALALWLRNEHDCKRWVAVVAANGRAGMLPTDLILNKSFFNFRDWRIP